MQDKSLRHIKDYRYFFFLAVLQFYSAAVLQFGSVNELNAPNALSFLLSNSQLSTCLCDFFFKNGRMEVK